jgi:predicted AlkP superfamily pyrophosphatase or phosphodiesterase
MKRAFLVAVILLSAVVPNHAAETPRLIVQITVDQLRGDMITRFDDRFGDGGFNWLLEHGVHYANAHYEHANTETIVGHACLATGAQPRVHGMVANVWLDRGLGRLADIFHPRGSLGRFGLDHEAHRAGRADIERAHQIGRDEIAAIGQRDAPKRSKNVITGRGHRLSPVCCGCGAGFIGQGARRHNPG